LSYDLDQLLADYKSSEMSAKTFSVLIAEKIGLQVMPGFALFVKNGQITRCYALSAESMKMILQDDEIYLIRYDFLHHSENLHRWLSQRNARPKSCMHNGRRLKQMFILLIRKGCSYRRNFVILVQKMPVNPLLGQTLIDERNTVFTEISDNPLMSHGQGTPQFFVHGEEMPTQTSDNVSQYQMTSTSNAIHDMIVRFRPFMGIGIHAEWLFSGGKIYVSHVRPSYSQAFPLSAFSSCEEKKEIKTLVVSSGDFKGYLKLVPASKRKIQELAQSCSKNQEKFIFVAKRPISDLVPLIPFAKGFIFREGGLVCHLAILLRERRIPAIILKDVKKKLKGGSYIRFAIETSHRRRTE
jgi:phosphoenolpyruvate synthase/pyruvate phosphate dikinase